MRKASAYKWRCIPLYIDNTIKGLTGESHSFGLEITMNKDVFTYSYSAPINSEVQEIRKKYLPKQESKFEELKRLDREVQFAGMTESLSVGIAGCLVFGVGMCLAMHVIGGGLMLGIFAGMIGVTAMITAFPLYRRISGKVKGKLAPRILQLAGELTGEE